MHIPSPWIGRKLNLQPDNQLVGQFVNSDDESPVFIDPTIGHSNSSAGLFDMDRFIAFLEQEGLECLWIVTGERRAWISDNSVYRSFGNIFRLKNGEWEGEMFHHDEAHPPK
jgi:hypothetical protein